MADPSLLPPSPRLMTKAEFSRTEYAKFAGHSCSRKYLSKPEIVELLAPAMHPDPDDPRRQLIDADHALKLLISNAGARYVPAPASAGTPSLRESSRLSQLKAEGVVLDNQRKRLDLERLLAETLRREDVQAAAAEAILIAFDHMKARNFDLAPRILQMLSEKAITSERDLILQLERSDRAVFEKIRDELRRKAKEGRPA